MLNAREPKIVNGPEILDKYVGGSEEKIRALFADAEKEQVKTIAFGRGFISRPEVSPGISVGWATIDRGIPSVQNIERYGQYLLLRSHARP